MHSSEVRARSETLDWPHETAHRSVFLGLVYARTERRTQAETIIRIWPGDPPSPFQIAGQVAVWDFDLQTHGASSTCPRAASKLSAACQL